MDARCRRRASCSPGGTATRSVTGTATRCRRDQQSAGRRGSAYDGWLDVNGSPYSQGAKFTERFRRPTFGHLQIEMTVEDAKAYTKPWTVRVDQRILPDQELIEFVCNENQQFRRRIKID